jgi:hypothetical protein
MRRPSPLPLLPPLRLIPALPLMLALSGGVWGLGAQEPERWALIVGVNDYVAYEDVASGDLRGAVNDAESVQEVLVERWGFRPENVLLLRDREATRAGIEAGFTEWLGGKVGPEDLVVFFFAGHGSQVWDEDGDEIDGLDETIAPADVMVASPENDITDDMLGQWIEGLPTDEVVVILDSCHSGTGTRLLGTQMRPRFLQRDLPVPDGVTPPPSGTRGTAAQSRDMDRGAAVELAAAAPDQSAMDAMFPPEAGAPSFAGGAFTTHLVQELWEAEAGATYAEVFAGTVESLKAARFTQDPQRSGGDGAPVFGVAPGTVLAGDFGSEVAVELDASGMPEIVVGARRRARRGTVYRTREGAIIRILEVGEERSSVTVLSGAVTGATLALPQALPFAEPELSITAVDVDEADREMLREALSSVEAVRYTEEEAAAHLFLRRNDGDLVVLAPDGGTRARLGPGQDTPDAIATALSHEIASQWLADLSNPTRPFAVDLTHNGGSDGFRVNDPIALRVRSESDGYLTVVDLGTDGTVTVLYPNRFVSQSAIQAGETLEIPTTEMPFRLRASEPEGRGLVRAFVTPEPLPLMDADGPLLADPEGRNLARNIAESLRDVLSDDLPVPRDTSGSGAALIRLDGWSSASIGYAVRQ